MTEKRYSFNWERGHPNFWDNHCDLSDCYLTCEDVVNRLNELSEEKKDLEEARAYYQENFLTMKTERNQLKEEKNEGFDKLHKMYMEQIEENKELKARCEEYRKLSIQYKQKYDEKISDNTFLEEENKQLKQLIKKVIDERVVDYPLLCKIKEMVEE